MNAPLSCEAWYCSPGERCAALAGKRHAGGELTAKRLYQPQALANSKRERCKGTGSKGWETFFGRSGPTPRSKHTVHKYGMNGGIYGITVPRSSGGPWARTESWTSLPFLQQRNFAKAVLKL